MHTHEVHNKEKEIARCPHAVSNFFYTVKGCIAFDRSAKVFGFVAKNSGETVFIVSRPDLGKCLGLAKANNTPIRLLSQSEMSQVLAWRNAKVKTKQPQQPQTNSEVNQLWQERSGLSGAKLAANTRKLRKLAAEGHQIPAGI